MHEDGNKLEVCDRVVVFPATVVWYTHRSKWYAADENVRVLSKDTGRCVPEQSAGGTSRTTHLVPSRRTERHVCKRRHPQKIRPEGRVVKLARVWLVPVHVDRCEYCANMARWASRLEAYLASGDVRGVARDLDPSRTTEEKVEWLLQINQYRSPAFPWDRKAAREFLDGNREHPPVTNMEEAFAESAEIQREAGRTEEQIAASEAEACGVLARWMYEGDR